MKVLDLNGRWDLRQKGADSGYAAQVPGVVHTDLLRAEVIEDPFYRMNEVDITWVGEADWVYEREFRVTKSMLAEKKIVLECDGLDTIAHVYVNNNCVGSSDNMFTAHSFDVTGILRPGVNLVRIEFDSALKEARSRVKAHPYTVPCSQLTTSPIDTTCRNFVRKTQCHFGWDWGPSFVTCGIYKDIRLVGYSSTRIEYLTVHQTHSRGGVRVSVEAFFDAVADGDRTVQFSFGDQQKTVRMKASSGMTRARAQFSVKNPQLWWPAGYGDQPLYTVTATVEGEDTLSKRVGLRDIRLVCEPDNAGESFGFEVNGVPVFVKGSNWIPADIFTSRADRARYDDLLTSALDAIFATRKGCWCGRTSCSHARCTRSTTSSYRRYKLRYVIKFAG